MGSKFLITLIALATGCTNFSRVATTTLESKQPVGRWQSGGDWMNISCSGAFSWEMQPSPAILGELRERQMSGGFVAEVGETEFIVGPIKNVFRVEQWPHKVGKDTVMIVDGILWTRAIYEPCN